MTLFSENKLLMIALILDKEEKEEVVKKTDMCSSDMEEKANRRGIFYSI